MYATSLQLPTNLLLLSHNSLVGLHPYTILSRLALIGPRKSFHPLTISPSLPTAANWQHNRNPFGSGAGKQRQAHEAWQHPFFVLLLSDTGEHHFGMACVCLIFSSAPAHLGPPGGTCRSRPAPMHDEPTPLLPSIPLARYVSPLPPEKAYIRGTARNNFFTFEK